MTYRPDIDGLRALAVLAVVAFHLGIEPLAGGYVGVDVFFVISGYLITANLLRSKRGDGPSVGRFYLRRARRLLPALFVTIALTFLGAALLMTPDDLMRTARAGASAVVSLSPFVFYGEAGYWDTASELKPLLHTWSLGVEEQFYLFWPAFVWLALGRSTKRTRLVLLAAVTGLGLLASEWQVRSEADAAFYLLPFRVFEFSLGALLLSIEPHVANRLTRFARDLLFGLGFSLIGASVLLYDGSTAFPGIAALWPCLGAALILSAGFGADGPGPMGRGVLGNPTSVWLGRVSYSMYLVHWPIVSLYRYRSGSALGGTEQLALAATILAATVALHLGVEKRFRLPSEAASAAPDRTPMAPTVRALVAAAGALLLLLGHAAATDGWAWRFDSLRLSPEAIETGKHARFLDIERGCRLDAWADVERCPRTRSLRVLVLGNSHEVDGFNIMNAAYGQDPDLLLMAFGNLGECRDLTLAADRWNTSSPECVEKAALLSDPEFVGKLDVVVYSSNKPVSANKQKIAGVLESMKQRNERLRVVSLGGYINTKLHCARLVNETGSSRACAAPENVAYFGDRPETQPSFAAIDRLTDHWVDKIELLCSDRMLATCATETPDGVPMSWDAHHLSREFAHHLGIRLAMAEPELLRRLASNTTDPDDPLASETGD